MESDFPTTRYCRYFQRTLELIGRRWTASILRCLFAGDHRFSDFKSAIPGISARLLSVRLKELMDAGLVGRHDGDDEGYYLTGRGEALREAFAALEAWNDEWIPEKRAGPRP